MDDKRDINHKLLYAAYALLYDVLFELAVYKPVDLAKLGMVNRLVKTVKDTAKEELCNSVKKA